MLYLGAHSLGITSCSARIREGRLPCDVSAVLAQIRKLSQLKLHGDVCPSVRYPGEMIHGEGTVVGFKQGEKPASPREQDQGTRMCPWAVKQCDDPITRQLIRGGCSFPS